MITSRTEFMNKRTLHKYLNGWKEVAKLENKEMQRASLRVKFKQILSIFKLGVGLNIVKKRITDEQTIRVMARGRLLKEVH